MCLGWTLGDHSQSLENITKSAYRAVSADASGEASFGATPSKLASSDQSLIKKNKKISARLPMPIAEEAIDNQPHIRGGADRVALYRRYHDDNIANNPFNNPEAQSLFNVLEQVRCEALGARTMDGVRDNMSRALEYDCKKRGLDRDGIEIPIEDSLYALLSEKISGCVLLGVSLYVSNQIRMEFDKKISSSRLEGMSQCLADQSVFARDAEKFVRQFLNMDVPLETDDEGESEEHETLENGENDEGDDAPQETSAENIEPFLNEDEGNEQSNESAEGESVSGEDLSGDSEPDEQGDVPSNRRFKPEETFLEQRDVNYHIYTSEFDEIVDARKLATDSELRELRSQLDEQLQPLQALIGKLANRLQRLLLAKQQRQWKFDEEEGVLNTSRLARIIADPSLPVTYKRETDTNFQDTVLTLLIDNSGSMRGRPITVAALTADILSRTLERAGVTVEVLGFTTAAWKGGKSREKWMQSGRTAMPGRLNDVRHIIYKSADMPLRRARNNISLMLKEGILKENIDGEALLWSCDRLKCRPEKRKILMVISDGAPVDDSTLSANRSGYLEHDLHQVIKAISKRGDVELTAIGIGHDVGRYYDRAITIRDVTDLPVVMMNELASLFDR